MSRQIPWTETDTIIVSPWRDPVIDVRGHDPRSLYAERFWLPIVGPSSVWLIRHVATAFDALAPDQIDGDASAEPAIALDLDAVAMALGVGLRAGRQRPIIRSIGRLVHFGVARVVGLNHLEVRRRLPPLARRHLDRLSPDLKAAHDRWAVDEAAPVMLDQQRRARELALSLIELGEDTGSVERQLLRWRFGPSLADAAVTWACEVHRHRMAAAATERSPIPGQGATNVLASSTSVRTP